ncbi:MAG TPA: hypothetical protein VK203_27725 [Nostocaceae cyanobacterium]|nr:hypothetical protein [Nostocaceae cyanobacterium]
MPKYIRQELECGGFSCVEIGYEPNSLQDYLDFELNFHSGTDMTNAIIDGVSNKTRLAIAQNNLASAEFHILAIFQELESGNSNWMDANQRLSLVEQFVKNSNEILKGIQINS